MNQQNKIFDSETPLPDGHLLSRQKTLLGFDNRYSKIRNQLRLLLNLGKLESWGVKFHQNNLPICSLVSDQYPLVIFHGDVGTGKTATAECVANMLAKDSGAEDSILFKISNRVRGSGKVGEMGTLINQAFAEVIKSAGKNRRGILIIDEGDSLASSRTQEHSHHEDKVAVNTLIQCIDDLRKYQGRIVVFLCTNRLSVLDAALIRRAAVVEEFSRPSDAERLALFDMDLQGLGLSPQQKGVLVKATGPNEGRPGWTFSDIRTRLYPAALAKAFPDKPLSYEIILQTAISLKASPVMEDR
ncbi:AAA family ATPase [Escherichia coli]|uniref:AAA family ATPase n=2 Tax=Enterobacterales TaxID=91347 RepID=A0A6D0CAY2_ECOLX|nr:ATP-binding protein [Klebsiella pneumoniae]APK59891.1 ATPase [Escherichia coli]EDL1508972.1 ATPase [Salmonella enterica subsp. enterica serovar Typhimurium]EFO3053271.1 AAA family ATPase [Escherichia coli O32]EKK6709740.1 AAA family ATPase [Salmonella enterica]ELZ1457260.1 AAA family ATPase [Shigella sonnei]EMF0765430.1 AAA family ATPase [Klebsiella variicola]MBW9166939.1 ATP-binding protein [Enterobacter hormaechei]HBT3172399.1 AAA family ATPase [Klebsiella aerogenes]HDT2655088.1 AAA f